MRVPLQLVPRTGRDAVIETRRIRLRHPQADDYRAWAQLRAQSRAFLAPWEPTWPADDLTRPAFRRRLRHYDQARRSEDSFPFFLFRRPDDMLLGGLTLSQLRRGIAQCCALGYWMGALHARRGYMGEAVAGALTFAFETLDLHRVEAACLPENEASQGLLRKAGFRQEGLARRYLKIDGQWRDHLLFAILRDDPRP